MNNIVVPRWFDLSKHDAKLDRIFDGVTNSYILSLNIPPELVTEVGLTRLERHGWVVADIGDQARLQNHRNISSANEILESLTCFYDKETIRESYVLSENLKQGERVEGLKSRDSMSLKDIEQEMAGVDAKDLNRITAAISNARKSEEQRVAKNSKRLLDGQGLKIIDKLLDQEISPISIAAVFRQFGKQGSRPVDKIIQNSLMNGDGVFSLPIEIVDSNITNDVRENIEHIMASYEGKTASVPSAKALVLGELRGRIPLSALEPEIPITTSIEELEDQIGFTIRRDKTLSTALYKETLTRLNKCTATISSKLGVDPRNIIPGQSDVVIRISNNSVGVGNSLANAMSQKSNTTSEDGEEIAIQLLNISAVFGGAFIHELGHLVDRAYGLSERERADLLNDSGVTAAIEPELTYLAKSNDADRMSYLSSDVEVFARTFEAIFTTDAISIGDEELSTLGGLCAGAPTDEASIVGNSTVVNNFLDNLKSLLDQKKSLVFSAKASAHNTQTLPTPS